MVNHYEVTVSTKDKDKFLNDFYEIIDAYILYHTMVSIDTDKITISINDEDLAFLALRYKIAPCRINNALTLLTDFNILH